MEDISLYDVVRYFIEKSGMLFFYSKSDIITAYNRILTILESEEKYNKVNNEEEFKKLQEYYKIFINDFDEYIYSDFNNLFIQIIREHSGLMYCASDDALQEYYEHKKKEIEELHKDSKFFKRKKVVKKDLEELNKIINGIREYKIFYELDVKMNKIDEVLKAFGLNYYSSLDEISEKYNELFNREIDIFKDGKSVKDLLEKNNFFAYARYILCGSYDIDSKIEKKSLVEKSLEYHELIEEKARDFFEIEDSDIRDIDVVITKVDKAIGKIKTNFVLNGNFSEMDRVLGIAEYYKKVIYSWCKIDERTLADEDELISHEEHEPDKDFSRIFSGLEFSEAKSIYKTELAKLLAEGYENNSIEVINLEKSWSSYLIEYGSGLQAKRKGR